MLAVNDFLKESRRNRVVLAKAFLLVILSVHFLISIFPWINLIMLPSSSLLGDNMDDGGRSNTATYAEEAFAQLRLPLMAQHATTTTKFSRETNEYHDLRAPVVTESIPLEDLVNTGPDPECLSTPTFNMTLFPSIRPPHTIDDTINPHQRIPKLIHMTGKSRCITETVRANLKLWEALPGYTIYFHDDAAVDRLLSKYWPHFPHLSLAQHCSISGAAKADIWRYLVLWEYGGLYTDIDNAPGRKFDKGRVILENDQAWFVVERVGVLSQYFMAAIPHHPFFFVALTTCLSRLIHMVEEIGTQYVPYITGPGVTKAAMMIFMNDFQHYQTVKEGTYTGMDGSTLTVMGKKSRSQHYIKRESIPKKNIEFRAMDMTHFSLSKNTDLRDSCHEYLYKLAIQDKQSGDD